MLPAAVLVLMACSTGDTIPFNLNGPLIQLAHVPRLGEHLSGVKGSRALTFAASAKTWPSYKAVVGGVEFTLGVDDDGIVRYVETSDQSFTSPERLHVGDSIAAARRASPHETVIREQGWGHYIRLESGWYAQLNDTIRLESGFYKMLDNLPSDARITMFFMR